MRGEQKKTGTLFALTIKKLNSKKLYKFDDVCEFQRTANGFCDIYCTFTGRDGMTNSFHNLRDGNFPYFLQKRGNLYRYSRQGWEAINGKMKHNCNHNTPKGGGLRGSSKLLPIFVTFSCGRLWRCGILDELFEKVDLGSAKGRLGIEYDKVPECFYQEGVPDNVVDAFTQTLLDMGSSEDIFGTLEDIPEFADFQENYGFDPETDILDRGEVDDSEVEEDNI